MSEDVRALFELCEERSWRIAVAESCTGGGLGAKITSVAGASSYFWGGIISYANDVKIRQLGVNRETLALNGAVSEEVAREMALGVRDALKVELGLAITGVAGPGAEGPKPEGRVCFGIATPQQVVSFTEEFGALGRENVRARAVETLLQRSTKLLKN